MPRSCRHKCAAESNLLGGAGKNVGMMSRRNGHGSHIEPLFVLTHLGALLTRSTPITLGVT
ncbi:MAG: hypothetical protein ACR2JB_25995 [Bryobacteraceae bacterium]